VYFKDNHRAVDIELLLERHYDIQIDTVPLSFDHGIEAYLSISGSKIYIDTGLADSDSQENRYRFTLAEELAHKIIHEPIYADVKDAEDWIKIWKEIPDETFRRLDKNAKELAGIILMPEKEFWKRAIEIKCSLYGLYVINGKPSDEQKSQMMVEVRKILMDDFQVNEEPCRIRLGRIEKWEQKSLFDC